MCNDVLQIFSKELPVFAAERANLHSESHVRSAAADGGRRTLQCESVSTDVTHLTSQTAMLMEAAGQHVTVGRQSTESSLTEYLADAVRAPRYATPNSTSRS